MRWSTLACLGLIVLAAVAPCGTDPEAGIDPWILLHSIQELGAELHDGIPCFEGPPLGCDPTKGTTVHLHFLMVRAIYFELFDMTSVVFLDGFESGFNGAWSFTSP